MLLRQGGVASNQYNKIQYNTIMTGHRQYARLAITTMVFLATASSSSSDIALEQHSFKAALETAWNASGTGVNVIAASPGTWPPPPPSPSCAAPKVWFFLCGHYRSHSVTQHSLKAMAEATAAGATSGQRSFCYMAAALMPDELDHSKLLSAVGSKGIQRFGQKWDVGIRRSGWGGSLRASYLLQQSVLGGRLAYAVVNRSGDANTYAGSFGLYWFGVWKVATWAASVHGFPIDGHTVVVRTRPDVMLDQPFSIHRAEEYFRSGPRGRHLVLGNEDRCCQNDVLVVTSFAAYESDVARPFGEAMRRRRQAGPSAAAAASFCLDLGLANGWAYGRSINHRAPWTGLDTLWKGCVCLEDGGTSCAKPACLVTTVESPYVYPRWKISRSATEAAHDAPVAARIRKIRNETLLDIADGVHVYCPAPKGSSPPTPRGYQRVAKSHWRVDRSFRQAGGAGFYRATAPSTLSVSLPPPTGVTGGGGVGGSGGGAEEPGLWPPMCGTSLVSSFGAAYYSEEVLPLELLKGGLSSSERAGVGI